MTDKELEAVRSQIKSLKQQINKINEDISELAGQIAGHYISQVQERFPGIQKGDKVRAKFKGWSGNEYFEVVFVGETYVAGGTRYDTMNDSDIMVRFYKVKSDGTQSLRYEDFRSIRIISLTKVSE
jgi:hypothetical protein